MVSLAQIVEARARIAGGVLVTPCLESEALSELTGARIFCKLEFQQRTGSFKERGARNALIRLTEAQRKVGVVAASAGNHALALAFHGRDLGIPVTVVMPTIAPLIKQVRCAGYGANVQLFGQNIAEAKDLADQLVAEQGLTYVHGFDGEDVIAGQGTIGLEILEQCPHADAVIVPIGGGGLIAGVGMVIKAMAPRIEVIGVEPEGCGSFRAALDAGQPIYANVKPTLADGLAVPMVGPTAFALARDVVDRVIAVDEKWIALAILRLLELEKGVVEGGGASALAPFLSGQIRDLAGRTVVLLLCGGNIDPAVLGRVIEHGLVVDGRLSRFRATISDRPGGLARLTKILAESGASVKQIVHERAFATTDISSVQVDVIVETRNRAHVQTLHDHLTQEGIAWQEI